MTLKTAEKKISKIINKPNFDLQEIYDVTNGLNILTHIYVSDKSFIISLYDSEKNNTLLIVEFTETAPDDE